MQTDVTRYLDEQGIDYVLKVLEDAVYTCEDAAEKRGVGLNQIIKTVVLKAKGSDNMAVACLPGDKKLNTKALAALMGCKGVHFVDRDTLAKNFGLTVGAIAPFSPGLDGLDVFMDIAVFAPEMVDISSGDLKAGVSLKSCDLARLLNRAVVADIAK